MPGGVCPLCGLLSRAAGGVREEEAVERAYAGALEKDRSAFSQMEELARAGDWDGLSQLACGFAPAGGAPAGL